MPRSTARASRWRAPCSLRTTSSPGVWFGHSERRCRPKTPIGWRSRHSRTDLYFAYGTGSNGDMQIVDRTKLLPAPWGSGVTCGSIASTLSPSACTDFKTAELGELIMNPDNGAHTSWPLGKALLSAIATDGSTRRLRPPRLCVPPMARWAHRSKQEEGWSGMTRFRPTQPAPSPPARSLKGHEDRFPRPRQSGGCRFQKRSFAADD